MKPEENKEVLLATLKTESHNYGLALSANELNKLATYYETLQIWNSRLHLVAPCSAKEFATRHLLESIFLTNYLPNKASVVDIGSGGGLPLIPCLVKRPDLRATLVESSKKKSVFLKEALKATGVTAAKVVPERFETLSNLQRDFVTCRALDKFDDRLEELYNWAGKAATLLLYGGPTIGRKLQKLKIDFTCQLLPNSNQRFLFIVKRNSAAKN